MANRRKPQLFGIIAGNSIEVTALSPHLLEISCTLNPDSFSEVNGLKEIVFFVNSTENLTFDLSHNLNNYNISVNNYNNVTKEDVFVDFKKINKNTVRLSFNVPPSDIMTIIRGKLEE